MSDLSDHAENQLANWLMTDQAVSRPTQWWVALYTGAPTDAGGGTEAFAGGYSRQEASFTAASGGVAANAGELSFSAAGAGFGTITALGVFDAESGGNLLAWKALSGAVAVADGQAFVIRAGDLTVAIQ